MAPLRGSAPDVLQFMSRLWALDNALRVRSKRMEAALGVTGLQRLVVRLVGRVPGITAGELARSLHHHPSSLTGALGRLVQRGYLVRRRGADARVAHFELTSKGRKLDARNAETVEEAVAAALAVLPRPLERAASAAIEALTRALGDPPRKGAKTKAPAARKATGAS